jgi:hypothetical protein
MAQDGKVISFNIDDMKIREVLTDPSGGSATYGSWIDFLGIQNFQLSPEFINKELPGDGTTLDIFSKLKKLTGQFTGQMVFAIMEILLGGAASYSGTTPNEQGVFTISGDDLPKYFEFDAQSLYRGGSDASGGDFHINIYKAKMTNFQYSMQNEEYALLTVDWESVPLLSTNEFGRFVENETRTDIAAGASDTTPPTVVTTVPADAATGVGRTSNLTVEFSEDVIFNEGNYALIKVTSTTDQSAVACVVTYNSTTFVATINPSVTLDATEDYTLVVSGVFDLAGNMLATPAVVNFVTGS